MAHTASTGSAKRTVDVQGKRLGIKRFGGQFVNAGEIILRQRGSKFYPGINTGIGRDFTIYSTQQGFVFFRRMTGHKRDQKYVDILVAPKINTNDKVLYEPKIIKEDKITTQAFSTNVEEVKDKKEVKKQNKAVDEVIKKSSTRSKKA